MTNLEQLRDDYKDCTKLIEKAIVSGDDDLLEEYNRKRANISNKIAREERFKTSMQKNKNTYDCQIKIMDIR